MKTEWQEVALGDVVDIKHGYAFKSEYFVDSPTHYVLTTPANFAIGGGFQEQSPKFYDGPIPSDFVLKAGDLIVTMTDLSKAGDTLGYGAIVPITNDFVYLHNQRIGLVLQSSLQADNLFLSYLMRMPDYRHWVVGSATGSTVKHTSPSRIKAHKILLPPLPEQRAIARILGSLDDKIELNRRMNATLEAMAQTLFKAWFVDFEPVKAKAAGHAPHGLDAQTAALFPRELEDSKLGSIPKGWKVKTLEEAFEINPKRQITKGRIATYLDMSNAPTQGHRPADWIQREFSSGMKFINGDTLLARITPCLENGKAAFVDFLKADEVAWGSTEFIVLRPSPPLPKYFGYLLCRHEDFRAHAIQSMTGTSGRQRVQVGSLGQYLIAVPNEAVGKVFSEFIKPLVAQIAKNSEQSRTLAQMRDGLLPRLISGQLRVADAMEGSIHDALEEKIVNTGI